MVAAGGFYPFVSPPAAPSVARHTGSSDMGNSKKDAPKMMTRREGGISNARDTPFLMYERVCNFAC